MASSFNLELPSARALHTTEQMELLDIVDSLRAQGLSEFTPLPQLIVCGDQSSGKSSVLEALSGVPFPRQENLCTRFATEVILRRATTDGIYISIVPAKEKSGADQTRLQQFRHHLATRDGFPELFEKAKDAMGLSGSAKGFSKDILRVEISGPAQPQLTLVDLPGLIHSETKLQTTQDVELVTTLVAEYMKYPRSIILAVVSAKNDVGNQIVLRRAREVDPQGKRTLGIITKPDTLPKGSSAEAAFLSLARNDDVKFELGWHVVKNLDTAINENRDNLRDEQETAYFEDSNFKNLSAHSTGIATLRTRLSKVLFNQIRLELPRLVQDIGSKIDLTQSELDKLGPSRSTIEQQRAFLIELSQSFQIICRDAIRGDYEHPFFQDDTDGNKRLCANLMNMHFAFSKNLGTNGSRWKITDKGSIDSRSRTREQAINEAQKLLKRSRGRELPGLPNPLLVGALFREYSSPWEGLAREHIRNVWEATNKFLELVLQYLTNTDVGDAVLHLWLSPIMDQRLQTAYAKLDELTAVHKDHPMTTNHYFLDNVTKLQQRETKEDLEEKLKKQFTQADAKLTINDVAAILSAVSPKTSPDMDLVAAGDAFDNMMAYYKVAMKLFMDNVPSLAIQAPIVREVPPMLCPTAVYSMDADVVMKIAAESDDKTLHRKELLRQLDILNTGARICKQYAIRPRFATKDALDLAALHTKQPLSSNLPSKEFLAFLGTPSISTDHSSGTVPTKGIFDFLNTSNGTSSLFSTPFGHADVGSSNSSLPSETAFTAQGSSIFSTKASPSSVFDTKAPSGGLFDTKMPFTNLSAETPSASDKAEKAQWSVVSQLPTKDIQSGLVAQGSDTFCTEDLFRERDGPYSLAMSQFQSINTIRKYLQFSFEEIRLVDYAAARRYCSSE